MRPLAPNTDKGRTVTGDDVHHKTRDTTPGWAAGKAKAMRHAARQEARGEAMSMAIEKACFEAFKRGAADLEYSLDTEHRVNLERVAGFD